MKTYKLKLKTVALIRKMIEQIKANPGSLNQNRFPQPERGGVCNSAFCAAGHLVILAKPKLFKELCAKQYNQPLSVLWDEEAARILGLPEGMRTDSIFGMAASWPVKFFKQYAKTDDLVTDKAKNNARFRAFAARWESFIETGGADVLPYHKEELKHYREENGTDYVPEFKFSPEVAA